MLFAFVSIYLFASPTPKRDGTTSPLYCATHCPLPRGTVMDITFFFDVLQLRVAIASLCLVLHAAATPTALSVLGGCDELAAPSRPLLDCQLGGHTTTQSLAFEGVGSPLQSRFETAMDENGCPDRFYRVWYCLGAMPTNR